MSKNPLAHSEELYEYIKNLSVCESPQQVAIREATADMSESVMQISPDQGQFMALLVKITNSRTIVEVGTFTGYSALSMLAELPPPNVRQLRLDQEHGPSIPGRPGSVGRSFQTSAPPHPSPSLPARGRGAAPVSPVIGGAAPGRVRDWSHPRPPLAIGSR